LEIEKKKCSMCGIEKSINNFYQRRDAKTKYRSLCKECTEKTRELYNRVNAEKISKRCKIYRVNNLDRCKQWGKNWKKLNKDKYRAIKEKWRKANPQINAKAAMRWRDKNIEKVRRLERSRNAKSRNTIMGNLNHRISGGILKSLGKNKAGYSWESLVGFTLEELKHHLEKHFLPGMSWENRKYWDIDHKIPLSVFNFQKPGDIDFHRAWNLSNLQPLWRKKNISKGAKLKHPFQPSLMLSKQAPVLS